MTGVHTVTASVAVPGAPVTLSPSGATVAIDDAWAPYGQIALDCAQPPLAELEAIDPRTPLRVNVTVSDGTVSRAMDLALRSRQIDHVSARLRIEAATDEALLQDLTRVQTTVDTSALAYQASLRALINNVVLAPIGAHLETDAGADADLTIPSAATNVFVNPSVETNTTGWVTATSDAALTRQTTVAKSGTASIRSQVQVATANGVGIFYGASTAPPFSIAVSAGVSYTFTIWVYTAIPNAVGKPSIRWGSSSAVVGAEATAQFAVPVNTWTRVTVTGTAPAGATGAAPWVWVNGAGTLSTGQNAYFDAARFSPTGADLDYFDGSTPATTLYTYAWTGTAHASTSTRTVFGVARDPAMFRWLPGETAWDFVHPLVEAGKLRLFCDTQRKWHLVDPANYKVSGLIQVSAGENAIDATDTISRDGEWFDSVVVAYKWVDAGGVSRVQWDVAGGPGTKTITVEKSSAWPGPGAAAALLQRSQRRGRVLSLGTVNDYRATPGMTLQAQLPGAPLQEGVISALTWDLPTDEMTITSRGLMEINTGAWLYQPVGESWNAQPVGTSWDES